MNETRLPGLPNTNGEATTERTGWKENQRLNDEFVVERRLGKGGMGEVYLVRSCHTGLQFAVKTIPVEQLDRQGIQRRFFQELRNLTQLPPHPQLASYRFFRTFGRRLAVFTDYVPGGSLADRIATGRLRTHDILDLGIQCAVGLVVVHEFGLVHNDVKPGNVLITAGNQVKINDFGLSAQRTGQQNQPSGATDKYRSPEQATGKPTTYKTDIWSWGATMLSAFAGEATWIAGEVAGYLLDGELGVRPPPMPDGMAEVLRRCFRREPAERWASMAEVAEAMKAVFERCTGRKYRRWIPNFAPAASKKAVRLDSVSRQVFWTDPRVWIAKTQAAAGQSCPSPPELSAAVNSPTAEPVLDLALYEEAHERFRRLVATGRTDLEDDLAQVCFGKGLVQLAVNDLTGAIDAFDEAVQVFDRRFAANRDSALAAQLADAQQNKAGVLRRCGDLKRAAREIEREIDVREWRVGQPEQHVSDACRFDLVRSYGRKADLLRKQGHRCVAQHFYQRAAELCRTLEPSLTQEMSFCLADMYSRMADISRRRRDYDHAVACFDQAIEVYTHPVLQEGGDQASLRCDLARIDRITTVEAIIHAPEGRKQPPRVEPMTIPGKAEFSATAAGQRPPTFADPAVTTVKQDLIEIEQRRLRSTFQRIVLHDASDAGCPLRLDDLATALPTWLEQGAHEWDILVLTLERLRVAFESKDAELTMMQAVVVFEYVAASKRSLDEPGRPPTQQAADAWFHKASIYRDCAELFPDVPQDRDRYLQAAMHCLEKAVSNPEFRQPIFDHLLDAVKGQMQSATTGAVGSSNRSAVTDASPIAVPVGPDYRDVDRELEVAIQAGNENLTRKLLGCGAKVNTRYQHGETPLHLAVLEGAVELVCVLLEHGTDVNATDAAGETPLHLAVRNRPMAIARILLDYGADPCAKDDAGETPAEIARKQLECFTRKTKPNSALAPTPMLRANVVPNTKDYSESDRYVGPETQLLHRGFAQMLKARCQDQFRAAEVDLRRALQLNPRSGPAYRGIGWCVFQQFEFKRDESLQYVSRSLEFNPQDGEAYAIRGELLRTKNPDEAAACWSEALRHPLLETWAELAAGRLGVHEAVLGRLSEALDLLELARDCATARYDFLAVLALVYFRRGDESDAGQALSEAEAVNWKHEQLADAIANRVLAGTFGRSIAVEIPK